MPKTRSPFPTQDQLLLPLLEVIAESGGRARPAEVYDGLAERVGLDPALRRAKTGAGAGGREFNAWERHVRFVRQQGARRGLIEADPGRRRYNLWEITERGRRGLQNIRPGLVITVYTTEQGAALFAEAESAVTLVADGQIDLLLTSPPYPLLRPKEYNNLPEREHVDWLVSLAAAWREKIAPSGSLVLNLADVWRRGSPTMSLYQERLLLRLVDECGYHLVQKFFWQNDAKMPGPAEWVTVRRVRVTPSVEMCWWLSTSENPKSDNRRVLRPYSESMRRRLASGGERARVRPSGHALAAGAFGADRGGSIPQSLLSFPNTSSNDAYVRGCRERGLPVHPARFPAGLAEFFIEFLTDPGDLVVDFFGGSAMTAACAERLGRRWLTSEKSLTYLRGGALRFEHLPSYRGHFDRLVGRAA